MAAEKKSSGSSSQPLQTGIAQRHLLRPVNLNAVSLAYINLSFSLSGEDLFLRKNFKDKLKSGEAGCYVDVGALHPYDASNSMLFYMYGWRGLCVDANPQTKGWFQEFRPEDRFVHAAVAKSPGTLKWSKHKGNTGMSKMFRSEQEIPEGFTEPIEVPALRLETILDTNIEPGTHIDFMSVDVEGMDLEVLQSSNWSKYRPRIVCVEDHSSDVEAAADSEMARFMKDQGYRIAGMIPPNIFFRLMDE